MKREAVKIVLLGVCFPIFATDLVVDFVSWEFGLEGFASGFRSQQRSPWCSQGIALDGKSRRNACSLHLWGCVDVF